MRVKQKRPNSENKNINLVVCFFNSRTNDQSCNNWSFKFTQSQLSQLHLLVHTSLRHVAVKAWIRLPSGWCYWTVHSGSSPIFCVWSGTMTENKISFSSSLILTVWGLGVSCFGFFSFNRFSAFHNIFSFAVSAARTGGSVEVFGLERSLWTSQWLQFSFVISSLRKLLHLWKKTNWG